MPKQATLLFPMQKTFDSVLRQWYRANARDIAWRSPTTSAWGILLSEVMSQQTPVVRVEPKWQEWITRWPTPCDLAKVSTDEVLRAWDRLGYPRRALRLKECAQVICSRFDGQVPNTVAELLALPGVGEYTARAVAAFAFGQRVPVVDTNVRRVYYRAQIGQFLPHGQSATKKELAAVLELMPKKHAPEFAVALMELGATVCLAKPDCARCPLQEEFCAWQQAGCPAPTAEELLLKKKRVQKFTGTDRQVRGIVMAKLRDSSQPVPQANIDVLWPDAEQLSRAVFSLLEDGLAVHNVDGYSLPVE